MKDKARRNLFWCRLFSLLFFLMLVLPFPLWAMLKNGLDTQNHENRELAPLPQPGATPLESIPGGFEAYLADRAPFRNQLMALNAAVNWNLFGTVNSDAVLAGKNGWLFLKNAGDSAPMEDYQGTNHYSEEQLAEILANLTALEHALAQKGTRLVLLIPPSKELVYRSQMPEGIPMVNPHGRIDALAEYLAAHSSITVVWPEEQLRALAASQQVYYKYDTHWNDAGAAFVSALLLQAMGVPGPAPKSLVYEPAPTPALFDLANLSATWDIFTEDTAWRAANWPGEAPTLAYSDENGYTRRYTSPAQNPQKLLMFRDSFGEAMEQPLAACFAESSFVHINAFDEDTLASEQPDIFVLEITQRYANRLLDYLPRLAAWGAAE